MGLESDAEIRTTHWEMLRAVFVFLDPRRKGVSEDDCIGDVASHDGNLGHRRARASLRRERHAAF